jgi:hypothetical protein
MKYLIMLMLVIVPCYSHAQDISVDPYFKVSLGYVLETNEYMEFRIRDGEGTNVVRQDLSYGEYDKYSYTLETGIKTQGYTFGLSYTDIISQSDDSKTNYRPYRFELFGQRNYDLFYGVDLFVGTGLLLGFDNTINYQYNGRDSEYKVHLAGGWLSRVTSRFGLVKAINNYEISLVHYSQWLTGWPINDDFENAKTELTISYIF